MRLLKVPEAMAALGCSRSTLYQLTKTGELRTVRLGRAVRIPADAIEALIARGGTGRAQLSEVPT